MDFQDFKKQIQNPTGKAVKTEFFIEGENFRAKRIGEKINTSILWKPRSNQWFFGVEIDAPALHEALLELAQSVSVAPESFEFAHLLKLNTEEVVEYSCSELYDALESWLWRCFDKEKFTEPRRDIVSAYVREERNSRWFYIDPFREKKSPWLYTRTLVGGTSGGDVRWYQRKWTSSLWANCASLQEAQDEVFSLLKKRP